MRNQEKYPKLRNIPYYGTKVPAISTRLQIINLLKKYGIENQMWGSVEGREALQFQIDTIAQGAHIKKMVRIDIPQMKAIKAGKVVDVPKAQVWRFIYYTLKSILEATKYNIFRLEHIFFSYILTQIPGPQPGTVETVLMKDLIEKHPLMLETGFRRDE